MLFKDDERVTESVDVLIPNVGEVIGGSMRMWDYDTLMSKYKEEGIGKNTFYLTWPCSMLRIQNPWKKFLSEAFFFR